MQEDHEDLRGDAKERAKKEMIFDPQFSRPLNTAFWTDDPALIGLVQKIWDEHFAETLAVDHQEIRLVPTECIILKDGSGDSGKAIEYEDSDKTNRMRMELTAYNDLLSRTYVDIPTLGQSYITRQDYLERDIHVFIGSYHQHVRRIFSRGSWELNGRFYGPWWQGVNSNLRSQIFINDTPTVEIDFKAMGKPPRFNGAQK